jgi:hypothetical protein
MLILMTLARVMLSKHLNCLSQLDSLSDFYGLPSVVLLEQFMLCCLYVLPVLIQQ